MAHRMIRLRWALWGGLVAALVLPGYSGVLAQEDVLGTLHEAASLYDEAQHQESIEKLEGLLESPESLSERVRIEVHKYLGFNYWELKQREEAKAEFKRAISLDPDLRLGSEVSPRIIETFMEALAEYYEEVREKRRERLLATTRVGAGLRSMVVPGWGQHYRGHEGKGYSFLSMAALSLLGWALADYSYRDAQDAYDQAQIGADFDALYLDVEKRADRANMVLYVMAAVWGYNILDALIAGPNVEPGEVGASVRVGGDGMVVGYRWRF